MSLPAHLFHNYNLADNRGYVNRRRELGDPEYQTWDVGLPARSVLRILNVLHLVAGAKVRCSGVVKHRST